jgi:pSer/pThr/pTyr-binding forkhead associated (FHA) protein
MNSGTPDHLLKLLPRFALVTIDPWAPPLRLELDRFPLVVGSNAKADIRIAQKWVSGCHCEIDVVDGQLIVRDLGSQSGTLVNDRRVDRHVLGAGDRITIGIRTFEVLSEMSSSETSGNGRPRRARKTRPAASS